MKRVGRIENKQSKVMSSSMPLTMALIIISSINKKTDTDAGAVD